MAFNQIFQIWNDNDTFPPVRISKSSYCLAYFCFQLQSDGEQCCERENMRIILHIAFFSSPNGPWQSSFIATVFCTSLWSLLSLSPLCKCNFIVHINLWPNKTDGRVDAGWGWWQRLVWEAAAVVALPSCTDQWSDRLLNNPLTLFKWSQLPLLWLYILYICLS